MNSSGKYQRTTQQQLQYYLQFCKDHPELQAGKNNPRAPHIVQELWSQVTESLNAMRGPTRSSAKWKETLSQWRNQLRCRARKAKVAQQLTGGGPYAPQHLLTEMEQQAVARMIEKKVTPSERNCSLLLRM